MDQNINITPSKPNDDLKFQPFNIPESHLNPPLVNIPNLSNISSKYIEDEAYQYWDSSYNTLDENSMENNNSDIIPEPLYQFDDKSEFVNAYQDNINNLRLPPLYWFNSLFNYYQLPYLNYNIGFYPFLQQGIIPPHYPHYNYYYKKNYKTLKRNASNAADKIEIENQDIFKTLISYNVPYPIIKNIVSKIASLTLEYTEE